MWHNLGAKRPEPILSFVQIRSGNRGEDLGNRTDIMIKSPPRRIYSLPKAQTNPSAAIRKKHWATWSLNFFQQQFSLSVESTACVFADLCSASLLLQFMLIPRNTKTSAVKTLICKEQFLNNTVVPIFPFS